MIQEKFSLVQVNTIMNQLCTMDLIHLPLTGGKKTIWAKKGQSIGQRKGFSESDIQQLNERYCGGKSQLCRDFNHFFYFQFYFLH